MLKTILKNADHILWSQCSGWREGENHFKKIEPKPIQLCEPLDWNIPEDNSTLDFLVISSRNPLPLSL